tara:strand:+ start:4693 stop:5166 length:474 start_codon:yes stop_codon:yes gene_type:complete
MKVLQILPTNSESISLKKKLDSLTYQNKDILIINSMLNPETTYPQNLVNQINSLDKKIIVDVLSISQVKKRNTLDWFSVKDHGDKKIFLIVGDCATCTYKASQDIFELNERGLDAYLVTFSEMKNLIIPKLFEIFETKTLFIDDLLFKDNLFKKINI